MEHNWNGVNISLPLNPLLGGKKKELAVCAIVVIDLIKTWKKGERCTRSRRKTLFVVPLAICNLCVVKFHDPVIILFQIIAR